MGSARAPRSAAVAVADKGAKKEPEDTIYDTKYFLNMITNGIQRFPSGSYEKDVELRLKSRVKNRY